MVIVRLLGRDIGVKFHPFLQTLSVGVTWGRVALGPENAPSLVLTFTFLCFGAALVLLPKGLVK